MMKKTLKNIHGFTLPEIVIGAFILSIAVLAIFGSILWGKYNATRAQYLVAASAVGRNQVEIIKSLGYFNATDSTYNLLGISSTMFNKSMGMGGTFKRTNLYSIDTNYDVEAYYVDDSSAGASRVIRVFTVDVYLHPQIAADTAKNPFNNPLVSYVTYLTPGGI